MTDDASGEIFDGSKEQVRRQEAGRWPAGGVGASDDKRGRLQIPDPSTLRRDDI